MADAVFKEDADDDEEYKHVTAAVQSLTGRKP
ncbi:hypothetical protein AB7M56_000107 [Bradyrhizobium elkanii]|uniref:Uncharacterized protein n=1 Tax=Bradyrhizobium elkanii TaxID=29448 RepID=A0A8I1XZ16_BRAEL|nr:hypothetical protein [Bradyrhizobium elkanii]MCP1975625.1 hypothetical protein [Bradyrhizobium elkanii]MCS3482390.1 hypothetical protein [Bradyrhizobium elkanii]MCS3525232.1 hypothetical protein [Bradyrhizobium elkanii]MCS4075865.1 hypothetical protein [Bradyrhizobium elkanii]